MHFGGQDMSAVLRDGRPGADVERLAQRDATEQASLEAGVRDPLSAEDLALPGACILQINAPARWLCRTESLETQKCTDFSEVVPPGSRTTFPREPGTNPRVF